MKERPEPGIIHAAPLREVNTRSSTQITGVIFSQTMGGRGVVWQGTNERAFVVLADLDPRISEIHAQPMLVEYRDDQGQLRHAYPDFAVRIDGEYEIHEVKPDTQYARPDVRRELELVARAVRSYGYAYSVALGGDLHRRCKPDAIDEAARRSTRRIHPVLDLTVQKALADGPKTIGEVMSKVQVLKPHIADFHAMLAQGRIRADMRGKADASLVVHGRDSDVWFDRLIPFMDPLEKRP